MATGPPWQLPLVDRHDAGFAIPDDVEPPEWPATACGLGACGVGSSRYDLREACHEPTPQRLLRTTHYRSGKCASWRQSHAWPLVRRTRAPRVSDGGRTGPS